MPIKSSWQRGSSTGPGMEAPIPPRHADLAQFVTCARELLDATDEQNRRQLETEVLKLAVPLHAAGVFEILSIAHPALATMVRDHLEEATATSVASWYRRH
ncbi:MAG: hypothetical protein J0H50_13690 [Xanthomonadales bacterium]|nr:hypothetical protein [Xanthomonadales bacterium]